MPASSLLSHPITVLLAVIFVGLFITNVPLCRVNGAENEIFTVGGMFSETFAAGGYPAMCIAKGGRLFIPDTQEKLNLFPHDDVRRILPYVYSFNSVSDRYNGEWRFPDNSNLDMQYARGALIATGGFEDHPIAKNPDVFSVFGGGTISMNGALTYDGYTFPRFLFVSVTNGNILFNYFGAGMNRAQVACERVPGPSNDWGMETVAPPVSAACGAGDKSAIDRVCQARGKRLAQPDTGVKDVVMASQVIVGLFGTDDEKQSQMDSYFAMGGSYNPNTQEWRWNDINEQPNGVVFSRGRCRTDKYNFDLSQPSVYTGWARNHYTMVREPFCFDNEWEHRVLFTFSAGGAEPVRAGGWRARSYETACAERRMYVICENLPSGVSFPSNDIVLVTQLYSVGAGSAFPLCSLTNNRLQPATIDSAQRQVQLEQKVMAAILTGDAAQQEANGKATILLGASYAGRSGKYPILPADGASGDWTFYTNGKVMQTGFTPSGSSTYNKWFTGYPTTTPGTGGSLGKVQLAYNMNIGGWINLAKDELPTWLACEAAPTAQTPSSSILIEPVPAGLASRALYQLCLARGKAPVAFDSAAKQLELDVKAIQMASQPSPALRPRDYIFIHGRYVSDVYPADVENGHWIHTVTGAPFMRGLDLSTGSTAIAYQNWLAGRYPLRLIESTSGQECAFGLGYSPGFGGWYTLADIDTAVRWVACVAGSGEKTDAELMSEKLDLPAQPSTASGSGGGSLADSTCIQRSSTTRGMTIPNSTVQAALEIALLKRLDATDSTKVPLDLLVPLAGSYDPFQDAWFWSGSDAPFTDKYSLEDGATADNTKQYQNWAIGYPMKTGGTNTVYFSLQKGGWVNVPISTNQMTICETGHEEFSTDSEDLFTVTAPARVATLSQTPEQASVLCEANPQPFGVPYPITDNDSLLRLEIGIMAKVADGSLTAGAVVLTNITYAEAKLKSLRVLWATGYPAKSANEDFTFLAYDTTHMRFINIAADQPNFIVACYQREVTQQSIFIVESNTSTQANFSTPEPGFPSLSRVCSLSNPLGSPLQITSADVQYSLQVAEMRGIFRGASFAGGDPILTAGRYVAHSDDWAWNGDQSRKFATGVSGLSFNGAYTNWPSGFEASVGEDIVASSAGMGVWTSVNGSSFSAFFVACEPKSRPASFSFVVKSPAGLPAPNSPHNMSAALCFTNDPPGVPLIITEEAGQRGLGIAVRRALTLGVIDAEDTVLLTRSTLSTDGSVSWTDGSLLAIDAASHIKWGTGYPLHDANHDMVGFSSTLAGWVNVDPSVAGVPYALACQLGTVSDESENSGDGNSTNDSANSNSDDSGDSSAGAVSGKIGVFLVAVGSTRGDRSSASVRDVAAGWAACAAHNGAPVQVVNATIDLELQSVVIKELLNTRSALVSDASTPVLLGAYKDSTSGEWGWVDPILLTDKLTPFNYTNWVNEPAEGHNYSSFVLSDGQWVSHNGAVTPTVAACAPYNYGLVVSPKPPVNGGGGGGTGGGDGDGGMGTGGDENGGGENSGGGGDNDPETGTDWNDPFAVCNLTGGVPLRVWNENVQNALESSAASPDIPDVVLLGGAFAGDTFSGAWQWMVKSSDSGHGPAFTQNYALDSDPAAVPVDGAYAKWAPGYPKLADATETAPSATLLAYSKSAGGWINVKPIDGPYQVICTTTQGADDGYIAYPPQSEKKSKGFPWWAILIIVLAVVVLLAVLIVVLCCCCCKKSDEDDHTAVETNDKLPEGPDKDIYYPPRDSDVPVANPLSPYVPADEAAPAKVREKRRSRQKRNKSHHAGAAIVDVDTDFMEQNTEIREDGDMEVFSPAEDVTSNHSVEEL